MPHIFLDESGNLNNGSDNKYFVIGSFAVDNPKHTKKAFIKWLRSKMPEKLKWQNEVKFCDNGLKPELKMKTLEFISRLDIKINFLRLLKSSIPFSYWKKDGLQSGLLYTDLVGEALEMYLPITDSRLIASCDKRSLRGIKNPRFKEILTTRFLSKLPANAFIKVEMIDSKVNENIQIADWIVGALACYFEQKENGEKYFEILKNTILDLEGKTMFG